MGDTIEQTEGMAQQFLEDAEIRGRLLMALADDLRPYVEPYIRRFYGDLVSESRSVPPPPSVEIVEEIIEELRSEGTGQEELAVLRTELLPQQGPVLVVDEETLQQDIRDHADKLAVAWLQAFELLPTNNAGARFIAAADLGASMLPKTVTDEAFAADLDALTAAGACAILEAYRSSVPAELALPEAALEYLLLDRIYVS